MWLIGRWMFESIKIWLVQLAYDWLTEAIQWWLVYGTFILVCFIIAVIVLGLHLLWRSLPGHWPISILGILGLIVWGALGNPIQAIAGWVWPHSPAPWERVDAIYYPDKENPLVSVDNQDVGGLTQCRAWVSSAAAEQNDPGLQRGEYQCGVGYRYSQGLNNYRLTVR